MLSTARRPRKLEAETVQSTVQMGKKKEEKTRLLTKGPRTGAWGNPETNLPSVPDQMRRNRDNKQERRLRDDEAWKRQQLSMRGRG